MVCKICNNYLICFFLSVAIIFNACSKRVSKYDTESLLGQDSASALSTDLTVNIPIGWKSIYDNENYEIDLWLVNESLSQSIIFRKLNFDNVFESGSYTLEDAANYSKSLQIAKFNSILEFTDEEQIEIALKEFYKYRVTSESNQNYFVYLFKYKNTCYECITFAENESNNNLLFEIQQQVLSSIK